MYREVEEETMLGREYGDGWMKKEAIDIKISRKRQKMKGWQKERLNNRCIERWLGWRTWQKRWPTIMGEGKFMIEIRREIERKKKVKRDSKKKVKRYQEKGR